MEHTTLINADMNAAHQDGAELGAASGSALECKGCKWWQADDEDDADNTGGTCRRYPPTVHAGTWGSYFFLMKTTSTHWPDADALDYCGEHTPND